MAFDYGSIDLGLKNPFKLEGKITALRGALQTAVGISLLVIASGIVKEDTGTGWILMVFGMLAVGLGIKALAQGISASLRYFVGRNQPTSLARNYSQSEQSTSQEEAKEVAYDAKKIEEMLVGRKNSTFTEPAGFLSRLLHSVFPKLLFLPYPTRNMAQRLFSALVSTIVALISYGLVAFVSLMGFAGEAGELAFPIYSAILMFYVLICWRSAGRPIARNAEHKIESLGTGALAKIISLSFILPVVIGLSASWLMKAGNINKADINQVLTQIPDLNAQLYLIAMLVFAVGASTLIFIMINARMKNANPVAEVSELRENWQESVHPNEVFINLDNLVMANRRYKEVPNRVYRELTPVLKEQSDGKGGFSGEMIQEIQPQFRAVDLGSAFNSSRLMTLLTGNLAYLVSVAVSVFLAYSLVDVYQFVIANDISNVKQVITTENITEFSSLLMVSFQLLLVGILIRAFAQLLNNAAHLFFAEMQFESLLVYFKCEGTYSESRINTGKGIHDSTESENTLVRSSITPWIIVSRVVSSTFAAKGMKNLEHPRHIMELHKDEQQLGEIKHDIVSFLKDRESIATITSERDLGNASQFHQLNEQTRASTQNPAITVKQEEEAAAYLQQKAEESKKTEA